MAKHLIIGGAGFIGVNLVYRLLSREKEVIVFDNLSRVGAESNLEWVKNHKNAGLLSFVLGDVREFSRLEAVVKDADIIYHLAAQVAVTTSVNNPREDFEINAMGTFNTLEAARHSDKNPIFIYASTNKVYGDMENIKVVEEKTRYAFADLPNCINESTSLDFHSPYGCSKGAGDQYTIDYSRIYGLRSVVARQSCIYGPRQFGIEDQGWLAWFIISLIKGRRITIYGDGKQVRDILYIDDLLDFYDNAINKIDICNGKAYNVGGGSSNTISVWCELKPILEELFKKEIEVYFDEWRPGDQRVFISDINLVNKDLNWNPKVDVKSGIKKLFDWIKTNKNLFN